MRIWKPLSFLCNVMNKAFGFSVIEWMQPRVYFIFEKRSVLNLIAVHSPKLEGPYLSLPGSMESQKFTTKEVMFFMIDCMESLVTKTGKISNFYYCTKTFVRWRSNCTWLMQFLELCDSILKFLEIVECNIRYEQWAGNRYINESTCCHWFGVDEMSHCVIEM